MVRRVIFFVAVLFFCSAVSIAQKTEFDVSQKATLALVQQLSAPLPADSMDLIFVFTHTASLNTNNPFYRILHRYKNTSVVRILQKNILPALRDSAIRFADVAKAPKEELTTGYLDLAVNNLNAAHAHFPAINGNGILASIKEQQFDTTDIDYAKRYVNTAAAAPTFTTHAAIMATTLAGAGNSSPFAHGAAPAASVTSTSFLSLLPEPDVYYQLFKISIQNHSYGTVAENYYGAEAAAYDESVVANPTLVHVFSAGNSGLVNGTGPYTNLQGWANLTGNFKTAKNTIVVGATDSFYNIATASSKGPAFDGRIKPELVAFGEDGSSGAAALTSGTVALLQQAYHDVKQKLPTAALVKTVLLNSAVDVGAKGLDYASGYGRLDGYNAVKTIVENRFFEDSVAHGVLKKFSIGVPPNAAQLKVTLAWTDVPAPVNAATALVNDLDLELQSNGQRWLPWVLNGSPNLDSVTKPAVRMRDTINNVEQITIDAPLPGVYTMQIKGSRIITPTQAFAIAYGIDTTAFFEWTFPAKNDPVLAGQNNVLRWQTTNTGTGTIEYATNNSTWKLIAANVPLAQTFFKWTAPDTFATARLRMRFSKSSPALSDTFVISKAVTVQVGFNCADSFLLFWNKVPASQYRVYNLENGYLQPVASTRDTAVIFKTGQYQSVYYNVAPFINGREGMRSFTIDYTTQGTACYFRSFYLQAQDEKSATFSLLLGTGYNVSAITFQKLVQNQFVTLQTSVAPVFTQFLFTDTTLIEGGNRYRIQIKLKNGALLTSDEISVFHFAKNLVFIYPNPVRSGQPINIRTNTGEHIRLRVFNATGALVRQTELNSINNVTTTTALPAGVYFIDALKEDGTRRTQKLVVY